MRPKGLLCGAAAVAISATAAFADVTGGVVKIGVLTDMSGTYSDLSGPGSVWAARKAVEDYTAANKGLKVEVIAADHQNKADISSNTARQWYDVEGVDAIVDLVTSSTALAVNQIAKEKNKVALVSGRPPPTSPASSARRTPSTGPTTPTRSPTARAPPW